VVFSQKSGKLVRSLEQENLRRPISVCPSPRAPLSQSKEHTTNKSIAADAHCIKTMIEVDKGIRRPELAAQFFSGDDFSRSFQQRRQHLKGLFLKLYLLPLLPQLPGAQKNEGQHLVQLPAD
jgi:hypothetical protein